MRFYTTTSNATATGFSSRTIYIRIGPQYRVPPPRPLAPTIHPCAMLSIPCNAALQQVTSAYRRLAKVHHPDLGTAEQRGERTRKMAEINHAYDLLLLKHREGG